MIFVDCDGVLADFDGGVRKVLGDDGRGLLARTFWARLREAPRFYEGLEMLPGAAAMMEKLEPYRPVILSGVPLGEWAQAQKINWARKHFPGVPMVLCYTPEKPKFCRPGDILIDDRYHVADAWERAGGKFILHRRAPDTLRAVGVG